MTTPEVPRAYEGAPLPPTSLVTETSRLMWSELHRCLVPGAGAWLAAAPAVVVAMLGRPGWALALLVLPCLALTGVARFAEQLVQGERPRLAAVRRVDPVLGVTLTGAIALAAVLLGAEGAAQVLGFGWTAVVVVLAPYALAYGAVRERRGLAAWRGAAVLVALRPSWALMVLALACLAFFAVAASAGVLAPLAPVWVLAVTASSVRRLLRENRVLP